MLVDEGKIDLDDPVSKFIPEFGAARQVRVLKPGSPPPPFSPLPFIVPVVTEVGPPEYEIACRRKQPITVRMLLNHTSGIQIFGVPNEGISQPKPGETLADVVPKMASAVARVPAGFALGLQQWRRIRGARPNRRGRFRATFNAFLKQRLLGPLGMSDTDFGVHADAMGRATGMFPGAKPPAVESTTYFSGCSGLWSTIGDYARFAQMLTDGGTAGGRVFLKPETVQMLSSNQIGTLLMGGYPPMALPPEASSSASACSRWSPRRHAGTQVPAGSFGWDGVGSRRFWSIPSQDLTIVMMAPPFGPGAAPFHRDVESAVMSALLPAK